MRGLAASGVGVMSTLSFPGSRPEDAPWYLSEIRAGWHFLNEIRAPARLASFVRTGSVKIAAPKVCKVADCVPCQSFQDSQEST